MEALWSLLAIVVAIYLLAIVTEEFFIISLDEVANALKMPNDVAGASLMAVGSSAPELSIAIFAVALGGNHANVGIGTIVGSAVFNILVITGISALVAGSLSIKAGSVERDVGFYLGSVALLVIAFWDGQVVLWEALTFVGAYIVYLIVLWQWSKRNPEVDEHVPHNIIDDLDEDTSVLHPLNVAIKKIFGLVARDPEKNYVWAMIISIVIIFGLSFVLVEAAIAFSDAIGLPPVIVSLTLIAAGTSAPDMIASVKVAGEGRGSMAVANAVGSNIFNVLLGLSLPWLVLIVFSGATVDVGTANLLSSIFVLCGTVILLYIFLYTDRKFTRIEGIFLLLTYITYVVYAIATGT